MKILRNVAVAKIFNRAIACGGISSSDFGNDEELKVELKKIWRNGWLHAEDSGSEIGVEGRGAGKLASVVNSFLFVLGTKGRMQPVVMAPKNLSTKH